MSGSRLSWFPIILAAILGLSALPAAWSQEKDSQPADAVQDGTLAALSNFALLRSDLRSQIEEVEQRLKKSISDSEKKELLAELEELQKEQETVKRNFTEIAAGMSLSAIAKQQKHEFNLQAEMLSLMEPIVREMQHMTSDVRRKSDLREEIAFYNTRLPKAKSAI